MRTLTRVATAALSCMDLSAVPVYSSLHIFGFGDSPDSYHIYTAKRLNPLLVFKATFPQVTSTAFVKIRETRGDVDMGYKGSRSQNITGQVLNNILSQRSH
jgi:hypothetical protein